MGTEIKKKVKICHCRYCHLCQAGLSEAQQNIRSNEPVRIGQILPAVMRGIEKRMQRSDMWMHEQLDINQPNVLK